MSNNEDELYHHGVKGMKWGGSALPEQRRFSHQSWKEKI